MPPALSRREPIFRDEADHKRIVKGLLLVSITRFRFAGTRWAEAATKHAGRGGATDWQRADSDTVVL